jgi:hypothetical protein
MYLFIWSGVSSATGSSLELLVASSGRAMVPGARANCGGTGRERSDETVLTERCDARGE